MTLFKGKPFFKHLGRKPSIPLLILISLVSFRSEGSDLQWELVHLNATSAGYGLDDAAYGAGVFVAVGNTNFVSSDGRNWTSVGSFNPNLTRVIYAAGKFVAVGGGWIRTPTPTDGRSIIVVSTNGFDWQITLNRVLQTVPNEFGHQSLFLTDVVYANGKFFAVGAGSGKMILVSEDAINWTEVTTDVLFGCFRIAYGNGIFVSVGTGVMTSSDGLNWAKQSGIEEKQLFNLYSLCYGGGLFTAGGFDGAVWESSDGINWTSKASNPGFNMHGIANGAGRFIAVGSAPGETTMTVRDPDSGEWLQNPTPQPFVMWGAAYGNGVFLILGENDGITRAAVDSTSILTQAAQKGPDGFQFTLSGPRNCDYRIEYSIDLSTWLPLTNSTSLGTTLQISDSITAQNSQRFYRTVAK